MTPNEIHWTAQAGYPILATLQLLPLVAMVSVMFLRNSTHVLKLGVFLALVELLIAFNLYQSFDHSATTFQFAEKIKLFSFLSYHAAVDGISVLFILLTSLLTLMLVIYGHLRKVKPLGVHIALIFAVTTSLQVMFTTQDLLLFVLFSIVELTLVAYMLHRWAAMVNEEQAMRTFMQFMATGILLLLIGTIMLGWNYADAHDGTWSFNLQDLTSTPVKAEIQSIIFFLLFYGMAVRIPVFPLHGWLAPLAQHGTAAVSGVFLLGLKTGVYGMMRFVFPVLEDAILRWQEYIVTFAVIGIFYAATLALMQNNLRRLLAFAVVSHTSVLVIGMFTLNHAAFQGSIMLSVNFGLAISLLLFMTGLVYHRTRTMNLNRLGGLFDQIPLIGIAFLVAGLSIIGMPGTPGFDAAHLLLEAAIHRFGALITIAAAVGNVIAAGFLLWAFQRAFLAPQDMKRTPIQVKRTTRGEALLALSMVLVLLAAGFLSEPWLDLIENSVKSLESGFIQPSPHDTTAALQKH